MSLWNGSLHPQPLPGLIERSFRLWLKKPQTTEHLPYTHTVALFTAAHYSSGHLFLSHASIDMVSFDGVYFMLFKAPSSPEEPSQWTDFAYPTIVEPSVTDVTFQTKNVIISGLCSGISGNVASFPSTRRVVLGSRDQVFVMLGFPDVTLWPETGTEVAMSLTGILTPTSPAR
jgi:hypothetical protein